MPAARCSTCTANFPVEYIGMACPICTLDRLDGIREEQPDPQEDLDRRVNEAEFERYYLRTRGVTADA